MKLGSSTKRGVRAEKVLSLWTKCTGQKGKHTKIPTWEDIMIIAEKLKINKCRRSDSLFKQEDKLSYT